MKRADAKRHDSHKPAPTQPAVPIGATDREIQLSLDRDELLGLMQDSLESLALKLGMLVASSLRGRGDRSVWRCWRTCKRGAWTLLEG